MGSTPPPFGISLNFEFFYNLSLNTKNLKTTRNKKSILITRKNKSLKNPEEKENQTSSKESFLVLQHKELFVWDKGLPSIFFFIQEGSPEHCRKYLWVTVLKQRVVPGGPRWLVWCSRNPLTFIYKTDFFNQVLWGRLECGERGIRTGVYCSEKLELICKSG